MKHIRKHHSFESDTNYSYSYCNRKWQHRWWQGCRQGVCIGCIRTPSRAAKVCLIWEEGLKWLSECRKSGLQQLDFSKFPGSPLDTHAFGAHTHPSKILPTALHGDIKVQISFNFILHSGLDCLRLPSYQTGFIGKSQIYSEKWT